MDAAFSSTNTASMKPFIKPRPAAPAQPEATAQKPSFSVNELTIFSMASGMSDATERAAYLDRTCGDDEELRGRIEERLAARVQAVVAAPVAQPAAVAAAAVPAIAPEKQAVPTALLEREQNGKDSPALALVPVSAMQFPSLPPQLQRQVTFAWGSATLMALAVGALAVLFYMEKDARGRAEATAKEATTAAENSLRDREASEAAAQEAKSAAQQTREAREQADRERVKAERERDEAAARATAAAKETERIKAEAEKLKAAKSETATAERAQMLTAQRAATLALGDSLAALANFQIAARAYADAEATSRQCLEIRTGNGIEGWPIVEARALLGEANLQRNSNAVAETELVAAAQAIEALGAPTNDTDRARLAAAVKRITLFFNAVGRRKEGAEWKRRIDAATAMPRPQQ
jgi:hypothetical protein